MQREKKKFKDPHKSWVFTINTFTSADTQSCKDLEDLVNVLYCAYEVEGRPHIQGYVTFKRSIRGPGLSKRLPRAHLEPAEGTKAENYKYVILGQNRDGTPKSYSDPFIEIDNGSQGTRTDLINASNIVRTHGLKRLAEESADIFIRNHKGLSAYDQIITARPPRITRPNVYWIYGHAGIGKSIFAYTQAPLEKVFIADSAPNWFDGLRDHDWIVFNEFDKDQKWTLSKLLTVTDMYPYRAPIKGSFVEFNVPNIVITSTSHPKHIYPETIDYEQVYRRITHLGTKSNPTDDYTWEKWPDSQSSPESIPDLVARINASRSALASPDPLEISPQERSSTSN